MSHTPGPWAWKIEGFDGYKLIAKDGTKVADDGSADGEYGGWMNDPNEPNARLIAAAPDLLEALKDCLDWMDSLRASGDAGNWDWDNDQYTQGIAAIAKATGGEV